MNRGFSAPFMAIIIFIVAANTSAEDCPNIDQPYDCLMDESGRCYWSYGEDVCRFRFNNPAFCMEMPNFDSCIISIGCRWNAQALLCEYMWDNQG